MPKMMLHGAQARAALARGVAKLTAAVGGTLGPRGLNTIIDRPTGTPIVSRDGVSIADEIELECRFENLGAQIVREVSKQTAEIAGDGTTTATVLANALVQEGIAILAEGGAAAADLIEGLDAAEDAMVLALNGRARPLSGGGELRCVASVAGADAKLADVVARALEAVGAEGVITLEQGDADDDVMEIIEGFSFDRGYVSHHMITDVPTMRAILHDAYILLTDHKITRFEQIQALVEEVQARDASLLIIADEADPKVLIGLLATRSTGRGRFLVVNPPDFGHWRKQMMEDIAILTGGEVISGDLGYLLERAKLDALGRAECVISSQFETMILKGRGAPDAIDARRAQIRQQIELAPQNIERDKLDERLSKMTSGTVRVKAGGVTPAERRRRLQLLDDALCAGRAALRQGIVAGGGATLAELAGQIAPAPAADANEGVAKGISLFCSAMRQPLRQIVENAGRDPHAIVEAVIQAPAGVGFDARSGKLADMFEAGVIDPVLVTIASVRNAVSSAKLILGTNTLIVDRIEQVDPTAGPARGGGAEFLGRA
ncbi:chaperonin Cpn60/TCP-1 [Methylocella silvestris BL2]|uniref:60 kDa chaperonin n=1 Tax=Methylocella silvestris (strain DSM 15510 / CIP 108128 / LMG 27833 / NCIMB 13906 / BL2) TaxID=395965 RepID=B8EK55_METSB|nr:molecular chaperone GroEL [Methylocella silvestris]ACK50595.1 chaperonin Cpn60/TCP-1 [Methylocella silvestris BL2]